MKKLNKIFALLLLFVSLVLQAQESAPKQKNWSFNGYVKYMQTISFTDINKAWQTDNLIHNRLNFNWYITPDLQFNAQMRNRIYYGEMVSGFPQYPQIVSKQNGYFDLSIMVFEEKSVFMFSELDRLFFDYNYQNFQITVGRQRINWGQTMVWNPNDLFNSYSFFDFDYEEKPGSDAIRLQFYPSYSSKIELAASIDADEKWTMAALYRFNKWNYDIQFMGGYYKETDYVLGAGFSGSLFKGGLRGELSYFHPVKNFADTSASLVMTLGYDYTFKNSLMLQFEALYNAYGKKSGDFNMAEFYFLQLSPQNLSLTRYSFMGQATYPITPLFNGTVSAMYNPNDHSIYFGPSVSYSLKENLELSVYTQYFSSSAESGGEGAFVYWRLKWSF
ncbi:MAG: hypothetical protein B7C24_03360 [Bacteroidetes bacterium 4572_77]|nr:MAG: hypothetical protein B7C24_03360 [Bacteroidetes bacterium 4572_77]